MNKDAAPDRQKTIKILMIVSILVVSFAIVMALVQLFGRGQKQVAFNPEDNVPAGEIDEYTQRSGQLLAGLTQDQINASLRTKLSYVWSQAAYYQQARDSQSLSLIDQVLTAADKDVKETQEYAPWACVFANDLAEKEYLNDELRAHTKKLCGASDYRYYIDPELQKLHDLITIGQNDTSGANSAFTYPDQVIADQEERLINAIDQYYDTYKYSWPISKETTPDIMNDYLRAQLYALFEKNAYAELYRDATDQETRQKVQLAQLDYLWSTGEVLQWYFSQYINPSVIDNPEIKCLTGQAFKLFVSKAGSWDIRRKQVLTDFWQTANTATCDVIEYTYGDPTTKVVDKDQVLQKLDHLDEAWEAIDYDQILAAGLLARQKLASAHDSDEDYTLREFMEEFGFIDSESEATGEPQPAPEIEGMSAEELDYWMNYTYTEQDMAEAEAIAAQYAARNQTPEGETETSNTQTNNQ